MKSNLVNLLMMLVIIVGSLLLIGADGDNDEKSSEDSSLELLKSGKGKGGQFTFLDFHSGMTGEEVFNTLAFDKNEYVKRRKSADYQMKITEFGTTDEIMKDLKHNFLPYLRDTSSNPEYYNKDGRDYVHALISFPLKLGKGEYSKNLYDNDMFHSMGRRLGQLRDSTIDLRSIEFYFTSKGLLWRVDVVFKNPSDYLIIDRIAKHQALNQIFPNVNLHNVARKTDSSYDADYYIGFEMIDYEISLKSIDERSDKYIEAYKAIK